MNFIIFFIYLPFVYSELHTFITTYTGINGKTTAGIPEFVAVSSLDGQQIDYYDSDTMELIPKQVWMKEFGSTDLWKKYIEIREQVQQINNINIHDVMERFSHSDGLHTYQRMYGCVWDDETGYSRGFDQHGYDGEDFISLDLKERRYFTPVVQGLATVHKWNNDRAHLEYLKKYYEHECVDWLAYFLKQKVDCESRERSSLCSTIPEVYLLQKYPSSPVTCHATGFYPSGVSVTWLKKGQEHDEDVDLGETLPNEDGTFQKNLSLIFPVDWKKDQYTCVVEHQGKTIRKILTDDEIKSNYRPTEPYNTKHLGVVGAFIVMVIVLIMCTVVCMKRKPEHEPVPSESEEVLCIDKGL